MKNKSLPNHFPFIILSLVFLSILLASELVCAETFYRCSDKNGNETLMDSPIEDQICSPIQTYEEKKEVQRMNKTIASPDDKITKIIVRRNQVLVPVTLIQGNAEENVHLLLDTGATSTMIHTEIADRLYINLSKAKKAKGEVVGGASIEASIIKMDVLKIGPHTMRNRNIFVVPYEGNAAKFDGLLGFDLLGSFGYKIDIAKQIIIWE